MWDGPPCKNSRTTDLSRSTADSEPLARAASNCGKLNPAKPRVPIRNSSRLCVRRQSGWRLPSLIVNIYRHSIASHSNSGQGGPGPTTANLSRQTSNKCLSYPPRDDFHSLPLFYAGSQIPRNDVSQALAIPLFSTSRGGGNATIPGESFVVNIDRILGPLPWRSLSSFPWCRRPQDVVCCGILARIISALHKRIVELSHKRSAFTCACVFPWPPATRQKQGSL